MKDEDKIKGYVKDLTPHVQKIEKNLNEFQQYGNSLSKTFAYWTSFLDASELLFQLIRADRSGDFNLHLDSVAQTILYFFAAGKQNYSRYTPVYVAEMKQLFDKDPETYQHLQEGGFVVRHSTNQRFRCVPTDQALEQTVNKDCKSAGGIIRFTKRKGVLLRWIISRHTTFKYSGSLKELVLPLSSNLIHEELSQARQRKDEMDVLKIKTTIDDIFKNPFDVDVVPHNLINIATGQVTSEIVQKNMTESVERATKQRDSFITQRMVDQPKRQNFWDRETKLGIKTFRNMQKPTIRIANQTISVDSEVLFRILFLVSKDRDSDLSTVLKFELSPVPPSLFHDDGTMRKKSKAELSKEIEANTDRIQTFPTYHGKSAYIIDGICLIQSMNEKLFETFAQFADGFLRRILIFFKEAQSVTILFDRYNQDQTIKYQEQLRRGSTDILPKYIISSE